MAERGVCYVPTVSVGGRNKTAVLKMAMDAGVTICNGSDVGVFTHGDNARELELLVDYGMTPIAALRAATSVDARVLPLDRKLGSVKPGLFADLLAVDGHPTKDIHLPRSVTHVMKGAVLYKKP